MARRVRCASREWVCVSSKRQGPDRSGRTVLIFFIPWLYLPLACGERAHRTPPGGCATGVGWTESGADVCEYTSRGCHNTTMEYFGVTFGT